MNNMRIFTLLLIGGFVLTGSNSSTADEGLWLLNKLPRKSLHQKYGFDPTDPWTEHIQQACIRFGQGGSASFVSPNGLVMTNHHVGADAIQTLSDPTHDYLHDGFYARTHGEELKCPDVELNVLMKIEEVTDQVNAQVTADMTASQAAATRKKAMAQIEKKAAETTGLKPEVVTLFRGARYDLYLYKRYTDVRLVMAPEFETAFFGGDLDNFEYPRFDLDVSFFRAYEDGKPARIKHYLKWSAGGAREGELVFVAGHPGRTQRLYTLDHLHFLRDQWMPLVLECYNQREVALIQFCAENDEHRRIGGEDLFGIQNGRKAFGGILAGLLNDQLMQHKTESEKALRDFVQADEKLQAAYGNAWARLKRSLEDIKSYYPAYFMLENRRTKLCRLFDIAKKLVRAADERTKPDGERFKEYRQARLPTLEMDLFSPAPIHDDLEQLRLEDGLLRLGRVLGGEHPLVKLALGGGDAHSRAAELLAGTHLRDVAFRKKLYQGGTAAIAHSDDTLIQFARQLDPLARRLRKRYEDEFESVEAQSYAQIAKAAFEKYGDSVYPDATFTLRLAIGTAQGYQELGHSIPYQTTFRGAYERAELHHHQPPFRLPDRWMKRKDQIDLDTPLNFVTTNDIIGGNSGSPMFNRAGEVVGLIFDGNIQGLVWDFQFDQQIARAVGVHSRAIIEAMRKIYDAVPLADEILGH